MSVEPPAVSFESPEVRFEPPVLRPNAIECHRRQFGFCLESVLAFAGMVTTLERKKRIYEICAEHDIVIIEDDPCYYLQYSLTGAGISLPLYDTPIGHQPGTTECPCIQFHKHCTAMLSTIPSMLYIAHAAEVNVAIKTRAMP